VFECDEDEKSKDLSVVMTFILKNICMDNFLGQGQIFKELGFFHFDKIYKRHP